MSMNRRSMILMSWSLTSFNTSAGFRMGSGVSFEERGPGQEVGADYSTASVVVNLLEDDSPFLSGLRADARVRFVRRRRVPALALMAVLAGGGAAPAQESGGSPPAATASPSPAPSATPGSAPAAGPEAIPTPAPAVECATRPLESNERDTLLRLAWQTLAGHL